MNLTKNLFLVYSRVQYLSMVYKPAQKERILRKKRNNYEVCTAKSKHFRLLPRKYVSPRKADNSYNSYS